MVKCRFNVSRKVINVSEVITDPDLAQAYTIVRSVGSFVKGVWTEGTPTSISVVGTISVASNKELRQLPEGDRIQGAMVFHSTEQIYTTRVGAGTGRRATTSGISDKILWRGDYYKVLNVSPYVDYGYYKAIGERIAGD